MGSGEEGRIEWMRMVLIGVFDEYLHEKFNINSKVSCSLIWFHTSNSLSKIIDWENNYSKSCKFT